jgi:hypothetical protein
VDALCKYYQYFTFSNEVSDTLINFENKSINMASTAPMLSPVQIHLLKFFSERPVGDEETHEIQKLIAKFYQQKAEKLMEETTTAITCR